MDKLLVKLLVIGIIVSLAWNAALSWAVFYDRSDPSPVSRPYSTGTLERRIDRLEGCVSPGRLVRDC